MSFKKPFVFIILLCVSTQVAAGIFVQAGIHFGGDTLVNAIFIDGSTDSIEAGGLLSGSLGYETDITDSLLLKLSAGLKFDMFLAGNSDVSFDRYPLEALVFVKGEKFHLGVGLSYHTGVKLTGDAALFLPTINFDDATGYVVQLDYLLSEQAYLSLNYTGIDYQASSGGPTIDGSSIGLVIGLKFGK